MTMAATHTRNPNGPRIHLVTGANGHLGNTLVRALLARGHTVRAGVRQPADDRAFQGLACERVRLELQDPATLRAALQGVDVLYQVAAVFRHWARDVQREIIAPNVEGTRLVLEAAAAAGVRRVVYVSSVAAVGHTGEPLDEQHWNADCHGNPYYRAKVESEQVAWSTARQLGLSLVTVLPGAIVGPYGHAAEHRLTDTMKFLDAVQRRQLPFDPDFHFNFVDVRDVAEGLIAAAERGRAGERYLLANRHPSSLGDMITALGHGAPAYRVPRKAPRAVLLAMAGLQQGLARLTGQPPQLLPSQVRLFHGVQQVYRIAKAEAELAWRPRPPAQALQAGFDWLARRSAEADVPRLAVR